MGRRWKNRKNSKLILTEIFPLVPETWYLKVSFIIIKNYVGINLISELKKLK
jgi:hypothetical protein